MNASQIIDTVIARRGNVANRPSEEDYILTLLNQVYRDVLAYHDWPWLSDFIRILCHPLIERTATVTQGSVAVTAFDPALTAAETVYETGYLGPRSGEYHEIIDINPATNTATLREPWLGDTATGTVEIWRDRYPVGAEPGSGWSGTLTLTNGSATGSACAPALSARDEDSLPGGWLITETASVRIVAASQATNTVTLSEPWQLANGAYAARMSSALPEVDHILDVGVPAAIQGGYTLMELSEEEIGHYAVDRRYPQSTSLYFWSRGGIDHLGRPTIRLWPVPREELHIDVRVKRRPPDLMNSTASVPEMPARWHEVLVYGTLALAAVDDGVSDPGTDRALILYTSTKEQMLRELAKTHSPRPRQLGRWDAPRPMAPSEHSWWRYMEQ